MVDLALQGCEYKDCYAFEKDKVYCLKIEVPEDYPIEHIPNVCESIENAFAHQNIKVIVLPQMENGITFEFFRIDEKEKGDKK